MSSRLEEIRIHISSIIANTIKLAILVIVIKIAESIAGTDWNLPPPLQEVSGQVVFDVAMMAVIIYYGYAILKGVRFFLDLGAEAVVKSFGKSEVTIKRLAYDLIYLIALIVLWEAVSPVAVGVPRIGSLLFKVLGLIFVVIGFLILYDMFKTAYAMLVEVWEKTIDIISRKINDLFEKHVKPKKE